MRWLRLHPRTLFPRALLAAAAVAFAAVPVSHAANPEVIHFAYSGTDTLDDFCGTGKDVDISFAGHVNVWPDPDEPFAARNQSMGTNVLTNPSTGATVITHSAYQFTDTPVSGDPNGLNTHQWVFKGLGEVIRAGDGGVLSAGTDAGYLVVDTTWDGPEFAGAPVSVEIAADRGGHPLFLAGDCSVLVPALGL